MNLNEFINKNETVIDTIIRENDKDIIIDNEIRRLYVTGDEKLYNKSIDDGVDYNKDWGFMAF